MPDPIATRLACDCHVHVFDPARFAYAPGRAYTPPPATVQALVQMHAQLGMERVVLVQPSVHGTDNACLLDALRQLGTERARAIAVVDVERVSQEKLARLHAAGVRGIRLNLQVAGGSEASAREQVRQAGRVLRLPGWSLQVHARLDRVVSLLEEFRRLERPVVLDHYAGAGLPGAAGEDLLARLLEHMRGDPVYVKLSAPYRLAPDAAPDAAARLARAFASAAPDRILWGSDWPHTGGSGPRGGGDATAIEPFRSIDNGQVLRELLDCLPDEDTRHRLLVRNPASLYGFAA